MSIPNVNQHVGVKSILGLFDWRVKKSMKRTRLHHATHTSNNIIRIADKQAVSLEHQPLSGDVFRRINMQLVDVYENKNTNICGTGDDDDDDDMPTAKSGLRLLHARRRSSS